MESWVLGVWIVKVGIIGEKWIVSVFVLIFILIMVRLGNFSFILF